MLSVPLPDCRGCRPVKTQITLPIASKRSAPAGALRLEKHNKKLHLFFICHRYNELQRFPIGGKDYITTIVRNK